MAQRRSTRRGTRTRRTRQRLNLFDQLLVAGIGGGLAYLMFLYLFAAPVPVAAVVGLVAFGFALGAQVRMRAPRLRSPLVWRRGR